MSEDSIGLSFLEWVNTFENISHKINEIGDLSDGVVFFEVLNDIDPRHFKLSRGSFDTGENWVLKVNNLKKLYKLLTRYYEEVLGQPTHNLDAPNLNAIARDSDLAETVKLGQMVVALAVQSERNQVYIEKIQALSQKSQHALMLAIEQVMTRLQAGVEDEYEPGTPAPEIQPLSARFDFNEYDEQLIKLRADYNRLTSEKEEYERAHKEAINELNRLRYSYDDLLGDREEMKSRIRELERALSSANESNKGEFLMRTEIDTLKMDLEKSESKRDEAERLVDYQTSQISDLNRRVEDLTRKAETAAKLKDQLQEYKHMTEKLQKAEAKLETYKKKLDETADLRKQFKTLEDQNGLIGDKLAKTEDEYRKVMAFKPMLDNYKDQVTQLTAKVNQMVIERNKLEYDIRRYQEKLTLGELEKQRDQDQIHLLEDRLKELELGNVGIQVQTPTTPSGSRLPDAQSERNIFELKSKITLLEREIDSLRHSRTQDGADQRVVLLENMLDDANRLKIKFEQELLASQKKNLMLENEIGRLKNGVDHDLSMTLRQRLNESEEELQEVKKRLSETEVALEESRKELIVAKSNLTMMDKDKVDVLNQIRKEAATDLEDLQRDHAALKMRLSELESESHAQLERLNQLLIEKDQLQSSVVEHKDQLLAKEREVSELKATLSLNETKDQQEQEQLRTQFSAEQRRNVRLTEQVTELQDQVKQLQGKMQKAKDFIRQQDRLFKETRTTLETKGGTFEETVSSLQSELKAKDEELQKLKQNYESLQKVKIMEQRLMMSAWYDMGRRLQREGMMRTAGQTATIPGTVNTSWLAQQRRMVDVLSKKK